MALQAPHMCLHVPLSLSELNTDTYFWLVIVTTSKTNPKRRWLLPLSLLLSGSPLLPFMWTLKQNGMYNLSPKEQATVYELDCVAIVSRLWPNSREERKDLFWLTVWRYSPSQWEGRVVGAARACGSSTRLLAHGPGSKERIGSRSEL